MNIRRVIVFVTVMFCVWCNGFSQQKKGIEYSGFFDSYYWRGPLKFTGGAGMSIYSGDLSGFRLKNASPTFSIGGLYKVWPRVVFGAEISYVSLKAEDQILTRKFTYSGTNIETTAFGRFYLREDIIRKHYQLKQKKKVFKPYVYTGISSLIYFPTTTDSLGVEVEEDGGAPVALVVPIGVGADFKVSNRIKIGPEFGYKFTFSDRIDDVGEEFGNPEIKDAFLTFSLKVTYSPFTPRKKPKKLSAEELEIIRNNTQVSDSSGSRVSDSTQTEEVEEYPDDNDLLQLEDETEEEGSYDSIDDYLDGGTGSESDTENEEELEKNDATSDEDELYEEEEEEVENEDWGDW